MGMSFEYPPHRRYALEPGKYPRAEPIEVYYRPDGKGDFEFVLRRENLSVAPQRPLSRDDRVGIAVGTYIAPVNYAQGRSIFGGLA